MESDKPSVEGTPDIDRDWWLIAQTIGMGVLGVWFLVGVVVPLGLLGNPKDAASLGDGFGMVNALFSGLAFAGLLVTMLMQRTELRMQRQELRLQRAELAESREVMREQAEQLAKQREQFEQQVQVAKEANLLEAAKLDLDISSTLIGEHPSFRHGGTVIGDRVAIALVLSPEQFKNAEARIILNSEVLQVIRSILGPKAATCKIADSFSPENPLGKGIF